MVGSRLTRERMAPLATARGAVVFLCYVSEFGRWLYVTVNRRRTQCVVDLVDSSYSVPRCDCAYGAPDEAGGALRALVAGSDAAAPASAGSTTATGGDAPLAELLAPAGAERREGDETILSEAPSRQLVLF